MKHHYIPLGSACDTAMSMNYLKIRKESLIFDWLWNLDSGLIAVSEIIQNDFRQITDRDTYELKKHYRFKGDQVVYREFPSIVHLHTDPYSIEEEHYKLRQRARRFQDIMVEESIKHFVYFRCYEEDLLRNKNYTINDTLSNLITEGEQFVDMIIKKYPNLLKKIHLLLIIQSNNEKFDEVNKAIKKMKIRYQKYIDIGYTITRNDEDLKLKQMWEKQWASCLINKTNMPFLHKFNIIIQIYLHKILKILRHLLKTLRAN